MKFYRIEKEEDVTVSLLRELLVIYGKSIVKGDGDYLNCRIKFNGEIFIIMHEGRIAKGSGVAIEFVKEKPFIKIDGD